MSVSVDTGNFITKMFLFSDGQEPSFTDSGTLGRGNKMAAYTQQLEQALQYANEKLSAAEKEAKKSPPKKPHKVVSIGWDSCIWFRLGYEIFCNSVLKVILYM